MSNWQSTAVKISFNDFTLICRICFAKNNLRNLQEVEYLIDVLQSLTNTKITNDDGLPQNICQDCIKKLENISDFMDLSKYNDSCLRQVYLTKKDIETNTITWVNNVSKDDSFKECEMSNENEDLNHSDEPQRKNNEEMCVDDLLMDSDGSSNMLCDNNYITLYSGSRGRLSTDEYIMHRREQNRRAAAKLRQKKQECIGQLTQTVEHLEKTNSTLKEKKTSLEKQKKDLIDMLAKFKCTTKHNVTSKTEKVQKVCDNLKKER